MGGLSEPDEHRRAGALYSPRNKELAMCPKKRHLPLGTRVTLEHTRNAVAAAAVTCAHEPSACKIRFTEWQGGRDLEMFLRGGANQIEHAFKWLMSGSDSVLSIPRLRAE